MNNIYPKWIDSYAKASYELFAGNVLEAFQPLDFYHFYPQWFDLWLDKIYEMIKQIAIQDILIKEVVKHLPPLSSLRSILLKLTIAFPYLKYQDKEKFKFVVNYIVELLKQQSQGDIFAEHLVHDKKELTKICNSTPWQNSTPEIASQLGRLSMTAGHLVNGLYNDVVTDMGWVAYGPYQVDKFFGNNSILIIREFTEIDPKELWPEFELVQNLKYKNVKIYSVYQNVKCHIGFISMHTTYNKSAVDTMVKHAVQVDGKWVTNQDDIDKLISYFGKQAVEHYHQVKSLDFEQLKQKVIEQECYQLHNLANYLGMNWKPSKAMFARVVSKPLLKNIYTSGEIINFSKYQKEFGIEYLRDLFAY